mgnify:FL=1
MTLNQLKYFCTACRTRSITKASEELFVTQPTISIAIKDLEAEFNIILFTRNGNHLELTSAGETFYEKAKDLLKHSTEMQNEFLELGNRVPVLKIGIPPMFSTIFFPEILDAFEQNHPDIQTELDEFGSVRACNLVQDEKLDLAIVNMELFNIDKFESCILAKEQLMYVVSKKHPMAKKKCMTIEDFRDENLLMFNVDSVQNELLKNRFDQLKINPRIIMRSSQLYTTLKFIDNGSCGCFLFSDMLPRFKQYKGIPLEPAIDVNIGIVWKKGKFPSHSAQLFIDFAMKYCSENFTT